MYCTPCNFVPGVSILDGAGENMETLDGERPKHASPIVMYQILQHEHCSDVRSSEVPQISVFTEFEKKNSVPFF